MAKNELLLGVDNFRYFVLCCFWPPCCDNCAGFWVIALVYCLCGWRALASLLLFVCAALLWMFYDVEVPTTGRSLVQRSHTECGVCHRLWRGASVTLYIQKWVSIRNQSKIEREQDRKYFNAPFFVGYDIASLGTLVVKEESTMFLRKPGSRLPSDDAIS
jgi:hypothetical protein